MLGALDVQSTRSAAFSEADIAALQTMADQIAIALNNARLFNRTAGQARRERLVVDITSKIRAAGDMDDMLRTAVTELRQALGVQRAAVRVDLGARPAGRGADGNRGRTGSGDGDGDGQAAARPGPGGAAAAD